MNSTLENRSNKLTRPPRHRMISNAATRLHRRKGLSRWWLAQEQKSQAQRRDRTDPTDPTDHFGRRGKVFLALCFLAPWCCLGATITGNLQTTSGNPYATNALFAP